MSAQKPRGFTLVELLVVIVIISVLVALLLPAIVGSRESARRAQCQHQLSQLGQALQTYESSKGHLPGYRNSFGSVPGLSWVAVLLPNIGRQDLWKTLRVGDFSPNGFPGPGTGFQLAEVICPSNPRPGEYCALGYAANCGIADGTTMPNPLPGEQSHSEDSSYGVFFNHDATLVPIPNQIKIRTDRIPDGAHRTIALSENVQAISWMTFDNANPPNPNTLEPEVGILWADSPGTCGRINQCLKKSPPIPRPSSMHPGGVNILFCDGHVEFQADDIDYVTYQHLMTPDSKKAGLPAEQQ
jgi:prepilin-type N-terminal cleavage/methylation domain-containing protein/prepilin-type processing-associated H-X9-DG protein